MWIQKLDFCISYLRWITGSCVDDRPAVRIYLLSVCTPQWFWLGSLRLGLGNGTAKQVFTDQIIFCTAVFPPFLLMYSASTCVQRRNFILTVVLSGACAGRVILTSFRPGAPSQRRRDKWRRQYSKGEGKIDLVTKHHAIKTCRNVEEKLQTLSSLGSGLRWMVSRMLRPLYPLGKIPYLLDRRLGTDNVVMWIL
jgi:hypothetical protein